MSEDELVEVVALAMVNSQREQYGYRPLAKISDAEGERYYVKQARAALSLARPIIERECFEKAAAKAEKLGACANTSGRGSCCETLGEDIAEDLRALIPEGVRE